MNYNDVKQFIESLNLTNLQLLKKVVEKQIEIMELKDKLDNF